ncbi:DPP IV N-terminal domain-containing protein [bacterium]|nr:DPP IV N-terminal domain-containing protein [bacterium]
MINNTDSIYSRIIPVQYPKVGTTNSAATVGVVSADGGKTVWMNIPGDKRNNYIARMDWADNAQDLLIQHMNRLQNTNKLMFCNATTGAVKTVFTDTDKAWVDACDDIKWTEDSKSFTYVSGEIYGFARPG